MRFLIADDHSIIRLALKHILHEVSPRPDIVEVSSPADCQEIFACQAADTPFDLAIIDLFTGTRKPENIEDLVAAAGSAPVVVFTASEQLEDLNTAICAGVRAYVPKSTEEPVLMSILRLVLAGGCYIPPHILTMNPRKATDSATRANDQLDKLTRRQREVLVLMADGLSNAEIGARLDLNLSTVKSHVTGVLRALDVTSRTQAVLMFSRSQKSLVPHS